MPSRFQPALLGGLLIGVLSALPGVNVGNCCCCLWVVCGGILTVYLQQSRMEAPIEMSDAVISGLLAGIIGALVGMVILMVLTPIMGPYQARMIEWAMRRIQEAVPNLPPETIERMNEASRQAAEQSVTRGIAGHALNLIFTIPAYMIFSMLGAMLGVAFFKKKMLVPPPAPPPVQL